MTNSNLYLPAPARASVPTRAWRALQRERWPFLITLMVLLGMAAIVIRRLPTVYQSKATILIEYPRSTEELSGISKAEIGKLDAVGEKANPINNQVALLSSRPAYEKALQQLNLDKSEAPYSGLMVTPKSGTDLIEVSYQSESPLLAAYVAQAVVDVYMMENVASNRAKGSSAETFLEQRLPELWNRLQTARNRLEQFQKQHQFLGTDVETNSLTSAQNDLAAQVNAAQAELIATDRKISELRSQLPTDLPTSLDAAGTSQDPGYQELQEQLLKVDGEIAQLQSRFTPEHPQLREALERRAELASTLNGRSRSLLGQQTNSGQAVDPIRQRAIEQWYNLEAERSAQVARLNQLRQQLQLAEQRSGQLPQLIKQQNELQLAVDTAQKDYLTFRDKYTTSQVAGQQGISNVRLVEAASEETTAPVAPNQKLLFALAVVVSTLAGLGVVWFRRHSDDDIDGTSVLREILPLPVLATVPWSGNGRLAPQEEIANSPLVESYRLLQAHLQMLPRQNRVLAVCSWSAGEGRSSVAANLALLEAEAGRRVLLVDVGGPARKYLGLRPSQPAELNPDILAETQSIRPWSANLKTVCPNYDRLSYSSAPATTLYKQWLALLERARERYDLILLDCPPTQEGPDATLLAAMADGVLWVVCPERLGRRSFEAASETLSTWSTRLLGQVVVGTEGSFSPEALAAEQPELLHSAQNLRPGLLQ